MSGTRAERRGGGGEVSTSTQYSAPTGPAASQNRPCRRRRTRRRRTRRTRRRRRSPTARGPAVAPRSSADPARALRAPTLAPDPDAPLVGSIFEPPVHERARSRRRGGALARTLGAARCPRDPRTRPRPRLSTERSPPRPAWTSPPSGLCAAGPRARRGGGAPRGRVARGDGSREPKQRPLALGEERGGDAANPRVVIPRRVVRGGPRT